MLEVSNQSRSKNNWKNAKYFDAFLVDKNVEACFYISQLVLIGNIPNWKCATNGILGRFDYPNRCSNALFQTILMNKIVQNHHDGMFSDTWTRWVVVIRELLWRFTRWLALPDQAELYNTATTFISCENTRIIAEKRPTDEIDHFVLCNFDTFCNFEPWFTCKYKLNKSFTSHCIS